MLKRPKLRSERGLAGSLLLFALAMGPESCLLPQEENVFPDLPSMKNSPPLIEGATVPESKVATVYVQVPGTTCGYTPKLFSITVVDDDRVAPEDGGYTDTLSHRWFIDGTNGRPYDGAPVTESPTAQRRLTSPGALMTQLGLMIDGHRHLVEVYVTDGLFGESVTAMPAKGQDRAFVSSTDWAVEVRACQ